MALQQFLSSLRCSLFQPIQPPRMPASASEVVAEWPVRGQIRLRRIFLRAAAVQQRVGQRAQHRLGVLPADDFQGAEAVRDVDRLVPDVAEIARAVAAEDLEELIRARGPRAARPRRHRRRLRPS